MSKYIAILLLVFSSSAISESVRVQVIDIGQADGIVIRTPSHNHWVVIDAGTGRAFADYLVEMGVENLDIAVVTHRHRDHQGGMDNVINAITPDLFVGIIEDCPTVSSDDIVRTAITNKSVPVQTLTSSPDVHLIDGVSFTILPLPALSNCPDHENSNSIVVRMDYGENLRIHEW